MYKTRVSRLLCLAAPALFGAAVDVWAQSEACETAPAGSAHVRGFVQEVQSGLAIDGAKVTVRWSGGGGETTSQVGGAFELCDVPANEPIVLQASVPPYHGAGVHLESLTPVSGVMVPIDFELDEVLPYSGRITGRLLDNETLQPIAGALVGNEKRGYQQVSESDGSFLLTDLSPGENTIRVRHLAYGERDNVLTVPYGTLEVELRLTPTVLAVAPLEVRILRLRSPKLERSGFYEREDWGERLGLGHYVTREDIAGRAPSRMSHLLAEMPRVDIIRGCAGPQCSVPFIRGTAGNCRDLKDRGGELVIGASLYVDGHRTRMAVGRLDSFSLWGVDELMMPGDVAGIEIYTGYGDLPGEFADSNSQRCGAVVIWTGR